MFTGLVEAAVPVRAWQPVAAGARLTLGAPGPEWQLVQGESLSVSGCCLTVAAFLDPQSGAEFGGPRPDADLAFDLTAETLARTWFPERAPGSLVNLERALRVGDRLGGHFVTGHVDGLGRISHVADSRDGGRLFTFEVPASFERWLVDKGSVAIDGISLTVVDPRGTLFDVAVIPETLRRTTLGRAGPGDPVHLEADPIGKWVERLVAPYAAERPLGD